MAVRNTDTTAATRQLQLSADEHALAVYQALLSAMRRGEIDHAEDGNDKALWRGWLNANGHLTQRKRPWSKKSFKRMLARLESRGLLTP